MPEKLKAKEKPILGNHKGCWCWLKPTTFCQEGICKDCQIFLDFERVVYGKDERSQM